jgi:hypothetical protein
MNEYADLNFLLIAIAFVATWIWLAVRIINRRERWAKWTLAAMVGVPVLYVASFGPACWITSRTKIGYKTIPVAYRPILWGMAHNDKFSKVLRSYTEFMAAPDWHWVDFSDSVISPYGFVWLESR